MTSKPFLVPVPDSPEEYLLTIDNSTIERFSVCSRSGEYYKVHAREGRTKSAALVFGSAIHKGLDAIYQGKPFSAAATEITRYFQDNPPPIEDYRTANLAIKVLDAYIHEELLPERRLLVARHDNLPIVEVPFEHYLTSFAINKVCKIEGQDTYVKTIHVAYSGKIDLIVQQPNGDAFVLDHKTTSVFNVHTTDEYYLSPQTRGYCWAAKKSFPDLEFKGAIINFIALKKPTNPAASLFERGPRGGEPPLKFHRQTYFFGDAAIEEWHKNLCAILSDVLDYFQKSYFPQSYKWCVHKFGLCEYFNVCTAPSHARSAILNSDLFQPVIWDPTK